MRKISRRTLEQELDVGIRGRLCVQAWLGYGEVLFLGFGDEVLPRPLDGQRHPRPPYHLQTEFADWAVEERSEVRGTIDDPPEQGLAACELLVGHRAIGWHLNTTTWALTVHFEGDLVMKVLPWTDEEHLDDHAWKLCNPAREYHVVTCRGDLYLVHGDEPPPMQRQTASGD